MITGARAPIALEFVRNFYKESHRVILADSLHFPISRWSKGTSKYYKIPPPKTEIIAFVHKINEIIATEKITHIIPTSEETFYISLYKLEFNCKVWTSAIDLLNSLHNKFIFYKSYGDELSVPKSVLLTDFDDWDQSENYVFKPIYSRFASQTIIGNHLNSSYFRDSEKSKWIAQQFTKGKEICVYSIWDNGLLKAYSSYIPLYRVGQGAGVFFKSVEHKKIFNSVRNFGEKMKYTGQLSFDVIIDQFDSPHFIECNPRGTSGAHLISDKIAQSFLANHETIFNQNKNSSLKTVMAIAHPFAFLKKEIRKSKDAVYASNDKWPFFMQALSLLEIAYIKFFKNMTWLAATTRDIEWNGYED